MHNEQRSLLFLFQNVPSEVKQNGVDFKMLN